MLFSAGVQNSNVSEELNLLSITGENATISPTHWGKPGECIYKVTFYPYFDSAGIVRYREGLVKVCNDCVRSGTSQACPWGVPMNNGEK